MLANPVPPRTALYFSETRFLNLGGRSRAADQTPAFLTLDPLRPESGILDRRDLSECAALFSQHQGDALDEADTLKVAHVSAECADRGGLRYPPRGDDTNYFGFKRVRRPVPIGTRARR